MCLFSFIYSGTYEECAVIVKQCMQCLAELARTTLSPTETFESMAGKRTVGDVTNSSTEHAACYAAMLIALIMFLFQIQLITKAFINMTMNFFLIMFYALTFQMIIISQFFIHICE